MQRYRMYQRKNGVFYLDDLVTKKQESLQTRNRQQATVLASAKNQAASQPFMNIALARAYLSAQSPELLTRTWEDVMKLISESYRGSSLHRWQVMTRSEPFQMIKKLPLIHTQGADFLKTLQHPRAGVATNKFLRILHNRAIDMGWLLNPVLARRAWPKFRYGIKRSIKADEHRRIIGVEKDPEHRLYYEMLWETGGAQSDVANLNWENIDLLNHRLYYDRMKLAGRYCPGASLVIGSKLEAILSQIPRGEWLFPSIRLRTVESRAARFRKRITALKIAGVTLHSYRYAWAERAKTAGMPEREAMSHLGHNSRAIHQAYSKQAGIVTMPLEYYEKIHTSKIIEFEKLAADSAPSNNERCSA